MRDRLRLEVLRYDGHRLDGDVDLLGSRMDRRLIDLDVLRPGALEVLRLLTHNLSEREGRVAPRAVCLVVRPVEQRVRAGEHALHGAVGESLRETEPVDGHRLRPRHLRCDDRLVVVAVPVGAYEPAEAEAVEPLREVRDHVAAVHLAVDEEVEVDALLTADPFFGRLLLEIMQLAVADLPPRVRVARILQVVGLPERPDGRREQDLAHADTPFAARAASTSAFSFFVATSCGRYSRLVVVERIKRRSSRSWLSAASTSSPVSVAVSIRVLRVSMTPNDIVPLQGPRRSYAIGVVSRLRASTPRMPTGGTSSFSMILSIGKKYG